MSTSTDLPVETIMGLINDIFNRLQKVEHRVDRIVRATKNPKAAQSLRDSLTDLIGEEINPESIDALMKFVQRQVDTSIKTHAIKSSKKSAQQASEETDAPLAKSDSTDSTKEPKHTPKKPFSVAKVKLMPSYTTGIIESINSDGITLYGSDKVFSGFGEDIERHGLKLEQQVKISDSHIEPMHG